MRWIVAALSISLTGSAILWAADVPLYLDLLVYTEQFLAFVLGLTIALIFLTIRVNGERDEPAPWYDWAAAITGFCVTGYIAVSYATLSEELAYLPAKSVVLATVLLILLIEAVRRAAGTALATLIVFFIAYGLFGHLLPQPFAGRDIGFQRLTTLVVLDPNGVLGSPLKVAATIVVVFVFFGNILSRSGGAEFFTELSGTAMGRYRGGAAKNSIVASGLFGSISGSAVSNVATTGIITIPLMRSAGFSASTAAGIEAVASTGGQLMPPVMGAAAFLMAEFLEVPYTEVVYAALVPAVLYFLSLFIQADLRAARENIEGVPREAGQPTAWEVLKAGWVYLVPFIVLICALFVLNVNPQKAGLYAIASFLLLFPFVLRGQRSFHLADLIQTMALTGRVVLDIIVLTAAAGVVIGVLNYSGLSFGMTVILTHLSENSIFLLLGVTAVVSIILGMGMPTVGVYVLLAALIAPSLVAQGFDKMAVHLFLLYFGMMSMITPPIAIAAFAAASIAKTDAVSTGWQAMKFGWIAFVIPFVFILSPGILLNGDWLGICFVSIGVLFGSIASAGHFCRKLGATLRLVFALAALTVLVPGVLAEAGRLVNWLGFVGGSFAMAWLWREASVRRQTRASASGSAQ